MREILFKDIALVLEKADLPEFDLVVGIARGGVVPASLVAYKLQLDLYIIQINYRDDENMPRYASPRLLKEYDGEIYGKNILLVDDVSVSGSTFRKAKEILQGNTITTFALKGRADFVLFPDIKTCVRWPWKIREHSENPETF